MVKFNSEYEKREWIARKGLDSLKEIHPNLFKYRIFHTSDRYSAFDSYFFIIDENGSIKKRVWIEMKIRDRSFSNYILEKKKVVRLIEEREKSFLNKEDVLFLYLNYTPDATYLWNITDIDIDNTSRMRMNRATSDSRTDKVDKNIILLEPSDAKALKYVLDPEGIIRKENERLLKRKRNAERAKQRGIF